MSKKNAERSFVAIDAFKLIFDSSVPLKYKLIPLFAALYLVFPLDFLTDLVPIFGYADDVGVAIAGMTLFTELARRSKNS
ncbi:DUF1232 domain-containing protein [Patescibacteria group bacterium]|nr:DUF1232 domain-containing protein [Patescibacteria group bacterium]